MRRSLELREFWERGAFCTLHPIYVPSKSGLECLARPGLRDETMVSWSRLASCLARSRSETQLYTFESILLWQNTFDIYLLGQFICIGEKQFQRYIKKRFLVIGDYKKIWNRAKIFFLVRPKLPTPPSPPQSSVSPGHQLPGSSLSIWQERINQQK